MQLNQFKLNKIPEAKTNKKIQLNQTYQKNLTN